MPPIDDKNNSPFEPIKVGIDPVFKSSQNQTPTYPKPPVNTGAFGVLDNQGFTPTQTETGFPPIVSNNMSAAKRASVRTFQDDMQSAIQSNHLSSINIALAENQKMQKEIRNGTVSPEGNNEGGSYSKGKVIIFISIILIIAAIGGISAVYFLKNKSAAPVAKTQELPSIITTEYKDEINTTGLTKNQLISTLSGKLNDIEIPVNKLYNAYLTTGTSSTRRLITAAEFVKLSGLKMPDQIRRTLQPDFMVGTYSFGKDLPFIIFKTSYFENTFAGMLVWEKDLESDFRLLFKLEGYENGGGLVAALTPTVSKKFIDAVITNKDVRLIKDSTGNTELLYAILDKETIIITVNEQAFKEIINRLNNEKGLKR
jgi:hypothetical protein